MATKEQPQDGGTVNPGEGDVRLNFQVQRIYLKDLSFETTDAPEIFRRDWKPEVGLDLHTTSHSLDQHTHEVVLALTVTVKDGEKTAFLVELKQAGIFHVEPVPSESQLRYLLGAASPAILYPYAREAVTDVVSRGTFPQLLLAPINFDVLYAQHMQRQQAAAQKATEGAAGGASSASV